jgi:periplasmic protein TonB
MWIADSIIMQEGNLGNNEGLQPMQGKTPLLLMTLMTAASVLIHALALGILFTTLVNPLTCEADRQHPPVIQVTLASLDANRASRPAPTPLPTSSRRNIDRDYRRKPSEVAIEKQQASQSNLDNNKQESLPPDKIEPMDHAPLTVSNIQLTPLSGGGPAGRVESVGGSPTSASFGGPNRFPPAGEDLAVVKPRYALTPSPPYPMAARNRGQEGLVLLTVEVLANGRTGQVAVKKSSGYALLDQSAQNAVRSWRFEPAKRQQTPQAMTVDIPIRFSIENAR